MSFSWTFLSRSYQGPAISSCISSASRHRFTITHGASNYEKFHFRITNTLLALLKPTLVGRFAVGRPCITRRDEHRNEGWELQVRELDAVRHKALSCRCVTLRPATIIGRYRIRKIFYPCCGQVPFQSFSSPDLFTSDFERRALIFVLGSDNDFTMEYFVNRKCK